MSASDRLIMVAGLPSGGTSVVAGMLAHLGVDMGRCRSAQEQLEAAAKLGNKRKYLGYECMALQQLLLKAAHAGTDDVFFAVRRYVRRRLAAGCHRQGFKNNLAVLIGLSLHDIESLPIDVVCVMRDLDTTFERDIVYAGEGEQRAKMRGLLHLALRKLVRRVQPKATLKYEELLHHPVEAANLVCERFGLTPTAVQYKQAIAFIDPQRCKLQVAV